jgi:competence protein ComEA
MSKSSRASRIKWSTLAIVIGCLLCLFGQAFAAKQIEGVININQASAAELQLLSGVGPAKAAKIIEYRGKHPFRTVEELGRVKGIGPRTVRKWRPHLTVSGPTTARLAGTPAAPVVTPTPGKPTSAASGPADESAGGAAAR